MLFKRIYFVLIAFATVCVFGGTSAQEVVFSAETADKVGIEDAFQLSFVLRNASGPSDFQPPSFSGFKVLQGPVQSSQNNISIVNGRTQRTSSLQLTYVLQPTKKGSFIINGAKVKIGGETYTSNTVKVQVVDGSLARQQQAQRQQDPFWDDDPFEAMMQQQKRMQQMMQQMMPGSGSAPSQSTQPGIATDLDEKNISKNLFIKVTVDNTKPYVGQQITASYKLYTRLPMNMSLSKLPSLNGFWSEDFKIPNPPKPTVEVINGQEYQVFLLKKSALFPQHTGKLKLDPTEAEGVVRVVEKSNRRSPLGNDPFFGSLFMSDPGFLDDLFSGTQYKDVQTKIASTPIIIDVQPLPVVNKPESFAGAVGDFKIETHIDSTKLLTGSTTNFQFIIKGSGNFQLIGEPKINFPPSLNALDPIVVDTIVSRTPEITGMKTFTYSLSPSQPGEFIIPGASFSYFDPRDKQYKTLKTNDIVVKVEKGKGNISQQMSLPLQDIHPNMSGKQNWQSGNLLFVTSYGYWLLYLLALAGFAFLVYRSNRQNDIQTNAALWRNKKANKVAWKRLAFARKLLPQREAHNAFYEEVSKAVWLYLSDKLNLPISELSKENIADNLKTYDVEDTEIEHLKNLLSECEMALYSPGGGQQRRAHTLDEATRIIGNLEEKLRKNKSLLSHA